MVVRPCCTSGASKRVCEVRSKKDHARHSFAALGNNNPITARKQYLLSAEF
jgi:hypothetical protein